MLGLGLGLNKSNNIYKKPPAIMDGLKFWISGADFTNSPPTNPLLDRMGTYNLNVNNLAYTSISGSDGYNGIALAGDNDTLQSNTFLFGDLSMTAQTFECTFKLARSVAYQGIFEIAGISPSSKIGRLMDYGDGTVRYAISVDGTTYTTINVPVSVGEKVTITGRYTGALLEVFKNGQFVTSTNLSISLASANGQSVSFLLGNDTGGTRYLQGTIYDAKVYNRVLTNPEVMQNYLSVR